MKDRIFATLVAAVLFCSAGTLTYGKDTTRRKNPSADPPESWRSIEDLNLVGAAVSMPAISDSILGTDSGFRRSLFSQGVLFRVNVIPRYSRYYEARLYQKAPFRSRPDDVGSFVASYRDHSPYVTDGLEAQGKTFWPSSTSFTGSGPDRLPLRGLGGS